MKKSIVKLLGAGVLVGTLFVTSCQKDQLTKEEALQMEADQSASQARLDDSLLQAGGIIRYSVLVYSANQASGKKEQATGLAGATVTLAQNGTITTVTCDADGIALFPNCRIGNVVVTVKATDHTTFNFKTSLDPGANNGNMSGTTRSVGTIAPVFATTGTNNLATITGNATYEADLTDTDREPVPAGTVVSAYIDANNSTFRNEYFNDQAFSINEAAGHIEQGNYETALSSTTTDASGNYTLSVPASVDDLPIIVYYADFSATQTLVARYLSNEANNPVTYASVKTVRTNFSQNFTSSNGIYSAIPQYRPVVATFEAPPAQGSGAAVSLMFKARDVNGTSGVLNVVQTGTLTPNVYTVTVNGGDYNDGLTTPSTSTPASLSITVGANGIASLTVGTLGYGYRSQPSFVVNYTGPNSVTLGFSASNPWNSEVADFNIGSTTFNNGDAGSTITSGGSGYVVDPSVRWTVAGGFDFSYGGVQTVNGVVVDVFNPYGGNNFTALPTVTFEPAVPVAAVGNLVTINSNGSVASVSMLNSGNGYSTLPGATPPAVTLTSLIPGYTITNPTLVTSVNGSGSISFVNVIYGGAGFPTQTVANTPSNSTGTFFQVNGGASSTSFNVKPNGVYVRDVYYGTGNHEFGAF